MSITRNGGPKWLFLLHQLPAKPAYARVKVWRRLQSLGAVTVGSNGSAVANFVRAENYLSSEEREVEARGAAADTGDAHATGRAG